MKNENPESKTKKKNADYYKKLDSDRTKKNCEYALLVSELEMDKFNDAPIVKVTDYPKMYMVRPPYFIAFLSIIESLGKKYKDLLEKVNKEIAKMKKDGRYDDMKNRVPSIQAIGAALGWKPLVMASRSAKPLGTPV